MRQKKITDRERQTEHEKMTVRTRRVMIYTFLLILALFYISARFKMRENSGAGFPPAGPDDGALAVLGDQAESQPPFLSIGQEDMWCLILTNAAYPVPEDYEVDLKKIPYAGQSVDSRIYDPLVAMLGAMEAEGLSPEVCSGYRNLDRQEKLFNRKVKEYIRQGHSWEESYELARQIISIPGSGEHCLGLAVDIYAKSYRKLETGFEETPEGRWLMENAQDYGFILRYGKGKESITGISYEPWHYRYVGPEAARYMKDQDLSLEEFYIDQSLYG